MLLNPCCCSAVKLKTGRYYFKAYIFKHPKNLQPKIRDAALCNKKQYINNMPFLAFQPDKTPESPQRQAVDAPNKIQILASLYRQKYPSISTRLILDWDICVAITPCQFPQRLIPIPNVPRVLVYGNHTESLIETMALHFC